MSGLLQLSQELIVLIFNHLVDDRTALQNLCLVGNRTLLAITRPLLWHEFNLVGDISPKYDEKHSLAHRFTEFTSDAAQATAVHRVKLTLRGYYDLEEPIFQALQNCLPKLINVTHACISCFEILLHEGSPSSLVRLVAESLPALVSITVEGCNVGEHDWDDSDFLLSNTLRHVACRFCDPALMDIWTCAPNIEVVELMGGHGKDYWHNSNGKASWGGYDHGDIGIGYMLDGSLRNRLTRLNVISDDNDDIHNDIDRIVDFFAESTEPLVRLEELVLDLPFEVTEYRQILSALRVWGPTIKRLKVAVNGSLSSSDIMGVFSTMLDEQTVGTSFWGQFISLEELWLPLDGLLPNDTEMLLSVLKHAPKLTHLYFRASRENNTLAPAQTTPTAFLDTATTYAAAIPTLQTVLWVNVAEIRIVREGNGMIRGVREGMCRDPWWQSWRGIGTS